jgi:Icc-related predicted phosphoesterase
VAKKETRLYVVSDFHASDPAWKKMLNAVRLDVYKADAVLYAGDLTGKAMVPVVDTGNGWEAELLGQRRRARSEDELMALERDIAALGYYAHRTTDEEVRSLGENRGGLRDLFSREIRRRVGEWLALAAERLEGSGVPVYFIPGNDDPYEIDDILATSEYAVNVDGRMMDIPGDLQLIGLGKSSPTPWQTPREVPEDQFHEEIATLTKEARDSRRTIFLIHCPPYDTKLDTAPLLDDNLRPVVSAGDLLRGPVGSSGVRTAVEEYRPLLSVHGHIHESGGERAVGETLCINPGSEAAFGILRGYIVDLSSDGIERVFRVEG